MSQRRLTREARKMQPFVANTAGFVVSDAISTGEVTIDHGALTGLADDDHPQYAALAQNEAVAGQWSFNDTLTARNVLPGLTDTYDLGSSTQLWRKGYLSELDAIVFAQNTVTLIGGWLLISKNEGKLPGTNTVPAAATWIDFGQAMTPNDFVLFRAAGKVEYMKIVALQVGTTYSVNRNLDGSGANDWPAGTPFCVLGQTGDGRIELNAYDTPRISIIEQGATYNAQTERLRLGDMTGAFGTGVNHRYGIGIGDYAGGNYLSYNAEAADTFLLKAGAGAVVLNANGINIVAGDAVSNKLKWTDASLNALSTIELSPSASANRLLAISCTGGTTNQVSITATDAGAHSSALLIDADTGLSTEDDVMTGGGLAVGTTDLGAWGSPTINSGDILYDGDLRPMRGERLPVYGYHPYAVPKTSTSWDGDARSSTVATLIDLSAVFGVPAGVKAVVIRVRVNDSAAWGTDGLYIEFGPTNTYYYQLVCPCYGGDVHSEMCGIVNCNADGDIYFRNNASGASTMDVILEIAGYLI